MTHAECTQSESAARYVAHDLDEGTQESFELHLVQDGCRACLEQVEIWRAIKGYMPKRAFQWCLALGAKVAGWRLYRQIRQRRARPAVAPVDSTDKLSSRS